MDYRYEPPLKVVVNAVRFMQPYSYNGEIKISDGDFVHLTIQDKNRKPVVNVKLTSDLADDVSKLLQEELGKLTGSPYRQY
jgi:hypothetical protein